VSRPFAVQGPLESFNPKGSFAAYRALKSALKCVNDPSPKSDMD
jgi:hypothetical protein